MSVALPFHKLVLSLHRRVAAPFSYYIIDLEILSVIGRQDRILISKGQIYGFHHASASIEWQSENFR